MYTLIIDVGCSNLKMAIYDTELSLCQWYKHPTPARVVDTLACIFTQYREIEQYGDTPISRVMVISYSDSVYYEKRDGTITDVPVFPDGERQDGIPPYEVSGKPENSQLTGIANALLFLKNEVGLEHIIAPT